MTDLRLPEELNKVDLVVSGLEARDDIVSSVDSWLRDLQDYYQRNLRTGGGGNNGKCVVLDMCRSFRTLVLNVYCCW